LEKIPVGFLSRSRHERPGFMLYVAAVKAARDPRFYGRGLGVPDTLDGRFDLVGLHAFLVIERLRRDAEPGPKLAQAVFDAMFADMDVNLRELGVGDLSVGKRVRAMWEAFHGRAAAYGAALTADDSDELATALARNLWRGHAAPDGAPACLAKYARAQVQYLKGQPLAAFKAGQAHFLPPAEGIAT
jgi:cytochrome b pre-mRNA-processing protein 3